MKNGLFEANVIGTFTVTVSNGRQEAQAVITVNPSVVGSPSQNNFQSDAPTKISTRSTAKKNKSNTDSKTEEISNTTSQNLQPGEGGWNNENWDSSDNPGNLPGETPGEPSVNGETSAANVEDGGSTP